MIDRERLNIVIQFSDLTFRDEHKKTWPPFSVEWIRDKFTFEAISGANGQLRGAFLALINTGCRPSEICGLMLDDIALDHNIPHIIIRPNEARALKNSASRREVPLVGISLEAMRRNPRGFPRYRRKDKFSNAINKFLRENGLLEKASHTAYSLRHSFEDRMLALNVPDRLAADLMGHSTQRERYGAGPDLAQKLGVLSRLAV